MLCLFSFESSVKISEHFHIDLKCALFTNIIQKNTHIKMIR